MPDQTTAYDPRSVVESGLDKQPEPERADRPLLARFQYLTSAIDRLEHTAANFEERLSPILRADDIAICEPSKDEPATCDSHYVKRLEEEVSRLIRVTDTFDAILYRTEV